MPILGGRQPGSGAWKMINDRQEKCILLNVTQLQCKTVHIKAVTQVQQPASTRMAYLFDTLAPSFTHTKPDHTHGGTILDIISLKLVQFDVRTLTCVTVHTSARSKISPRTVFRTTVACMCIDRNNRYNSVCVHTTQ